MKCVPKISASQVSPIVSKESIKSIADQGNLKSDFDENHFLKAVCSAPRIVSIPSSLVGSEPIVVDAYIFVLSVMLYRYHQK